MPAKKTHSVSEVDALTASATVDGYAECHGVVTETMDQMLGNINGVISIYMANDLGKYVDRVKELDLMYTTIQAFAELFESNYFEKLDELKECAETEAENAANDN